MNQYHSVGVCRANKGNNRLKSMRCLFCLVCRIFSACAELSAKFIAENAAPTLQMMSSSKLFPMLLERGASDEPVYV